MAGEPSDSPRKPDPKQILPRIEREAGVPGLAEILAERLAPTDLQSLLLEVYRRRARKIQPSMLLDRYEKSRFVKPAHSDPKDILRFERLALDLLPGDYEAIELSPVSPTGTHSAFGTVDQNNVVTTSRNTEVVADSTNVLALESAVRRRGLLRSRGPDAPPVKLCASHRVLRAQHFDAPGSHAHFRILALTAAGRDTGSHRFEMQVLREQLDYWLRLLAASGKPAVRTRIRVTDLTDGRLTDRVEEQVFAGLATAHPHADLGFDPDRRSGRGYYVTLCFKIHGLPEGGEAIEIGDGGCTDWTQRLMNNRKERFLTGCLAGERVVRIAGA